MKLYLDSLVRLTTNASFACSTLPAYVPPLGAAMRRRQKDAHPHLGGLLFLCMLFAKLTYRESSRDLGRLAAIPGKPDHLGVRARTIARSAMVDANEKREWRIFAAIA